MAAIRPTKSQTGVHVNEEDLLPPISYCPLCLATTERKKLLLLQTEPDVYLLGCASCRGHSASRLPTEKTLQRYYGGYYKHSHNTVTFDDPPAFARHLLTQVGRFLNEPSISILDFGGGGGDLSRILGDNIVAKGSSSVHVDLVDYSSKLSKADSANVTIAPHQTLAEVKGKRYSLVLASAVLEHIPFPRAVLIDLLSSIKPGGVFYARTPSVAPILRILRFLGMEYDFTFPGHLHDLGQAFWEQVPRSLEAETGRLRLVSSRPSVVETSFSRSSLRTLAAYMLKAPWYLLGRNYRFVGGWEVVIQRPL